MRLVCLLLLTSLAFAQTKIATIDTAKLVTAIKAKDSDSANVENEQKKLEEEFKAQRTKFEEQRTALMKKNLSQDAPEIKTFRADLEKAEKDFLAKKESFENKARNVYKRLSDSVFKSIKEYAESKKIDLVLDKGAEVSGPVLYGKSDADITEDVMEQLGL